jgi:hypothetical protein
MTDTSPSPYGLLRTRSHVGDHVSGTNNPATPKEGRAGAVRGGRVSSAQADAVGAGRPGSPPLSAADSLGNAALLSQFVNMMSSRPASPTTPTCG